MLFAVSPFYKLALMNAEPRQSSAYNDAYAPAQAVPERFQTPAPHQEEHFHKALSHFQAEFRHAQWEHHHIPTLSVDE